MPYKSSQDLRREADDAYRYQREHPWRHRAVLLFGALLLLAFGLLIGGLTP